MTGPEGPMRGEVLRLLGDGQRSGPLPHQLGSLGESCHCPSPPSKKYPRICMNPVAMPVDGRGIEACPLVLPMATLLIGLRVVSQ